MNKYLNVPVSLAGAGNTGKPTTHINPNLIIGAILTSKTKKFSEADIATLQTKLQEATLAAGSERIYPIFRFKAVTDNTSDVTKNTSGYGDVEISREGKYDWTFMLNADFGLYTNKQFRKLNNGSWRVLFVTKNNLLMGSAQGDDLVGFNLEHFYMKPWKVNDGTNSTQYACEFAMSDTTELNDSIATTDINFDIEDTVKGLINIEIGVLATASGKVTLSLKTEGDKVNLYDSYADEFATASNWDIRNASTGAVVTPTTVAKNSTLSGWDITLAAGDYVINLASPTDLATANIGGAPESGYEGIAITETITVNP